MNLTIRKWLAAALLLLLTVGGYAPSAFAHANLVSAVPENGSVVAEAPQTLVLRFSETLEIDLTDLALYDGYAREIPTTSKPYLKPGDASQVMLDLPPLDDGTYTAVWNVVSEDGHPVSGSVVFSVGQPTAGYLSPTPTTNVLEKGSLVAARYVVTALLLVGGGLYGMTLLAKRRGRNAGAPSHLPTFAQLLGGWRKWGWMLLLLGLLAEWFIYSATLPGNGLLAIFTTGNWHLLLESPFALMVTIQLGLLILLALPQMQESWYALIWMLLVATLAIGGHAWGIDPVWLAITVRALHLLTLALWLGGLSYLLLTLLHERRTSTNISRATFRPFFTRTMLIASLLVLVTGIVMTLLQTDLLLLFHLHLWTGLLLAKVFLLAVMLFLATWQTLRWRDTGTLSRRLLRGEWWLGLLALVAAIWLSQSAYPLPTTGYDRTVTATDTNGVERAAHVTLTEIRLGTHPMRIELPETMPEPQHLFVTLEMTDMEMGEQTFTATKAVGTPGYIADIGLTMSGNWRYTLTAHLPDNSAVSWTDTFELPKGGTTP
ncbi:MAG TPA: copper resistance protein CopC [Bacilli bacterium]|nr:copper resistance protein CopC [Bacilli bacterium]